jgi:hypothetical protein
MPSSNPDEWMTVRVLCAASLVAQVTTSSEQMMELTSEYQRVMDVVLFCKPTSLALKAKRLHWIPLTVSTPLKVAGGGGVRGHAKLSAVAFPREPVDFVAIGHSSKGSATH